jgi:hypothetical protein
MRTFILAFIVIGFLYTSTVSGQVFNVMKDKLEPNKVSMSVEKMDGKDVVKVVKDPAVKEADQPTYVKLKDIEFKDGTIEVRVLSKLVPNAPEFARGFIGVAFRIDDTNSKFECIYIRPTNGRAEDQIRRNHSIQYFSYPDYTFQRLRKEAPEQYESYADMGLNEWINMKIVVKGAQAKLFLNTNKQPSLVVNDLKHGADASGSIGLWVDGGTEGYFADVKISK